MNFKRKLKFNEIMTAYKVNLTYSSGNESFNSIFQCLISWAKNSE